MSNEISDELSNSISALLRRAVEEKPENVVLFIAEHLEKESGLNPEEFAKDYEVSLSEHREIVLEDFCPANADPVKWVPTRYSDPKMFELINGLGIKLAENMLRTDLDDYQGNADPVPYPLQFDEFAPKDAPEQGFWHQCKAAYPELAYVREDDAAVKRMFKNIYLLFRSEGAARFIQKKSDETKMENLSKVLRQTDHPLEGIANPSAEALDVLLVCCMIQNVWPVIAEKCGFHVATKSSASGFQIPDITDEIARVLPSYRRISQEKRDLVNALWEHGIPLPMLLCGEIIPGHLHLAYQELSQFSQGLGLFWPYCLAMFFADKSFPRAMMGDQRQLPAISAGIRCIVQICCISGETDENGREVSKSTQVCDHYTKFLETIAETVQAPWKDKSRFAAIRLFLMSNIAETAMSQKDIASFFNTFSNLEKNHKDSLTKIFAKDGINTPAVVFRGGSKLFRNCLRNNLIGLSQGLEVLAAIAKAVIDLQDPNLMNDMDLHVAAQRMDAHSVEKTPPRDLIWNAHVNVTNMVIKFKEGKDDN